MDTVKLTGCHIHRVNVWTELVELVEAGDQPPYQ